jgi:CheY-like chemotaxis protein
MGSEVWPSDEDHAAGEEVNESTGQSAAPYVLVVDDDEGMRRVLRAALEKDGYRIDSVSSGAEALALLEQQCPDVLISDLIMPEMAGDELARRCIERCPSVRIVFVSGFRDEQLRDIGITQVVFMPKPMVLADLRAMVARLLRL